MLNSKYKIGDLVQTGDHNIMGIVTEVRRCGLDMTLPRNINDEYSYIIKTNKQDIIYFESELELIS